MRSNASNSTSKIVAIYLHVELNLIEEHLIKYIKFMGGKFLENNYSHFCKEVKECVSSRVVGNYSLTKI
jgi:hypothetical protein